MEEVGLPEKAHTRAHALSGGMTAWVRIGATSTDHWARDLEALQGLEGVRGAATRAHAGPSAVGVVPMPKPASCAAGVRCPHGAARRLPRSPPAKKPKLDI